MDLSRCSVVSILDTRIWSGICILGPDLFQPATPHTVSNVYYQGFMQGSHFSGLTKFHDISMIFPGFLVNFQVFFHYFFHMNKKLILSTILRISKPSFLFQ